MRTSLPSAVLFGVALALSSGCPIEYTVPLDTESDTSDDDSDDDDEACSPPLTVCGSECVDLDADGSHCGDCDEACGDDDACVQGVCTDSCDNSCDAITEVCDSGTCMCRTGFSRCGETCVDLQSDPLHCGECDETCTEPEHDDEDEGLERCQATMCLEENQSCSPGLTDCASACVDLQSHPLHCGACDRPCNGTEACVEAECVAMG